MADAGNPERVTIRTQGCRRILEFTSPAYADAWRIRTGAALKSDDSRFLSWRYDATVWFHEWGAERWAWVVQLQNAALDQLRAGRPGPWALTLEQLGRLLGVSVPTVRRFVAALNDPEGFQGRDWDGLRAYLEFAPVQRPRSGAGQRGSVPYTVAVLLEPYIHPEHAEELTQFCRRLQAGQGQMLFEVAEAAPETEEKDSQTETLSGDLDKKDSQTESLSGPISAPSCAHGHGHGHGMAYVQEGHGHGGPDPPSVAAQWALEQAAVPPHIVRIILEHPKGPEAALRWCLWLGYIWSRVDDPTGFLIKRIQGYCRGTLGEADPPSEYQRWLDDQLRATYAPVPAKRAARLSAPPPAPPPPRADIPASLVPYWSALLKAAAGHVAGLLEEKGMPLRIHAGVFVVSVPDQDTADWLGRHHRAPLSAALRERFPGQVAQVEFITPQEA